MNVECEKSNFSFVKSFQFLAENKKKEKKKDRGPLLKNSYHHWLKLKFISISKKNKIQDCLPHKNIHTLLWSICTVGSPKMLATTTTFLPWLLTWWLNWIELNTVWTNNQQQTNALHASFIQFLHLVSIIFGLFFRLFLFFFVFCFILTICETNCSNYTNQ